MSTRGLTCRPADQGLPSAAPVESAQLVLARQERSDTAIQHKSFNAPDELRRFPKGILTLVHLGSVTNPQSQEGRGHERHR
jgi:hypothetical protein